MNKPDIEAKLAAVKRSYVASLPDKLQAIDTHWRALKQDWDNTTFESLYRIVHSLAGSAETFGFAEITAAARSVVTHFKQVAEQPAGAVDLSPIETKLTRLQTCLRAALKSSAERRG